MKSLIFTGLVSLFLLIVPEATSAAEAASVGDLRTEYAANPIGIDERHPRFSWKLESDERGVAQTAYQIRVAEDLRSLESDPFWNTGKVASDASIHVPYDGPDLASRERYHWQVRIWDEEGAVSEWSAPAFWEMGLLRTSEWEARWIQPDLDEDTTKSNPSPMLREEFAVNGDVASARLYATARGLYELELNGERVGDLLFTPGWTSYDNRIQYQVYDVTDLLERGDNAIGARLGDGWYRGRLAWKEGRNIYGSRLALLAQLEIRYEDGSRDIIATDEDWRASTGAIVLSDIYDGEIYDARLEKEGWSEPGYDASSWEGVRVVEKPLDNLVAQIGPPVRRIEELTPVERFRTPEGDLVYDMGQNMVGWVRLRVSGPEGARIKLRHAEVLDREGNFYTENLRSAKQTVEYTLKGEGVEVYEPRFTFQGFRYVAVEGLPEDAPDDALTGVVIHSDMPQTGVFETSDERINQLQHNILWGQKGNFLEAPTDCPQRDERLGWTGDAQVFASTAAFNMDVAGFFTRWLGDLAVDQKANGAVPSVIPDVLNRGEEDIAGPAGWADASVIVPWTLYLAYGDERILQRQYDSMKDWVAYMQRTAGDNYLWTDGWHYGDWLAFSTDRSDYPGATTDKDLIATAFFAHSTDLLRQAAEVLGRDQDARRYAELYENVKQAFRDEFITANGRVTSNTQTAYALALSFGLIPDDLEEKAAERLADDVREFKHLTTGFLGTPYLNSTLSECGYLEEAYALLLRDEYPSWLYPITQGATTIWERWDGQKPDGSFQNAGMNSFNHYAYGAIGNWMYRTVAGLQIDPREPGYKHTIIAPEPGGDFTYARAEHESMYGLVGSAWEWEDGRFSLTATVPPNTTATVHLPDATVSAVRESGSELAWAAGVVRSQQEGADVVVELGSGTYRFTYPRAR